MRILGVSEGGYPLGKTYIVEVSVDELKKVANKAGYRQGDELEKLKPGQDYPLAEGYDFRADIVRATEQMQAAYKAFSKAVPAMTRFAGLIAQQEPAAAQNGEG